MSCTAKTRRGDRCRLPASRGPRCHLPAHQLRLVPLGPPDKAGALECLDKLREAFASGEVHGFLLVHVDDAPLDTEGAWVRAISHGLTQPEKVYLLATAQHVEIMELTG